MPTPWEVTDDGSWNGVRRLMRVLDDGETIQVKTEDVGSKAIVEQNKASEGVNKRSDLWHVGHIPASLGLKWLVEEGIDMWNPAHQDAVRKKLMDSDYRHLVPGCNRIIF